MIALPTHSPLSKSYIPIFSSPASALEGIPRNWTMRLSAREPALLPIASKSTLMNLGMGLPDTSRASRGPGFLGPEGDGLSTDIRGTRNLNCSPDRASIRGTALGSPVRPCPTCDDSRDEKDADASPAEEVKIRLLQHTGNLILKKGTYMADRRPRHEHILSLCSSHRHFSPEREVIRHQMCPCRPSPSG